MKAYWDSSAIQSYCFSSSAATFSRLAFSFARAPISSSRLPISRSTSEMAVFFSLMTRSRDFSSSSYLLSVARSSASFCSALAAAAYLKQ